MGAEPEFCSENPDFAPLFCTEHPKNNPIHRTLAIQSRGGIGMGGGIVCGFGIGVRQVG